MITYKKSDYHGFERLDFTFNGKNAILVCPNERKGHNRFLMKMEYFTDFPELEIEMLKRGYHVAYLENRNRWGVDADCDDKAAFCDFLSATFYLYRRCIPVGMSCGGFHAVNFASRYPDYVSLMYLDAPLLSFLSLPMGCGVVPRSDGVFPEITEAYGFDWAHALAYAEQPVHRLPKVIANKIPVALVYGDADDTVNCQENALILLEMYEAAGAPIKAWAKAGCNHHPHGPLQYMDEVIAFIEENMR